MLRIGVIGAWGRGTISCGAHRPTEGIQIVAATDISPEGLEKYKERLGDKSIHCYLDYREMLRKEKLDAVFITTPDYCHEEQAIAALRKKIAVYLEKPMAITIRGCDRILKTACKYKAKLFLGHNMRYMPFIHKMKNMIDSGEIGEVKAVWCRHFISYGGDAYFKDWHSEQKYATSLLLQKGAHDIDIIHWLAGGYTNRVTGFGSLSVYDKCPRRKADEKSDTSFNKNHYPPLEQTGFSPIMDVEDQNLILMRLSNGVQASYMQCHFTPDTCRNYTIIGTKGRIENLGDYKGESTVELWNTRQDHFRLHGDVTHKFEEGAGGHGGADTNIITGFLSYLIDNKKPYSSPVASRNSVATGFMGAKSIRAGGKPQDIPELDKEVLAYFEEH